MQLAPAAMPTMTPSEISGVVLPMPSCCSWFIGDDDTTRLAVLLLVSVLSADMELSVRLGVELEVGLGVELGAGLGVEVLIAV